MDEISDILVTFTIALLSLSLRIMFLTVNIKEQHKNFKSQKVKLLRKNLYLITMLKSSVFWDVTRFVSCKNRRFR
jgi:hypothetical protein